MANYNVNISKKCNYSGYKELIIAEGYSATVGKAMIIEKMRRNEEKSKASSK